MQILVELYGTSQADSSAAASNYSRNAGVAQVHKVDNVTLLRRLQDLRFGDRIPRPRQKRAPSIRIFRSARDVRLLWLVVNLHLAFRIDFGSQGIHSRERKKRGRLDYSIPVEWVDIFG